MRKLLVFLSALCFSLQSSAATEQGNLDGLYEYAGNLRDATISKIEIRKIKGQQHVHIWFYGRPSDVDWGDAVATEYRNPSMERWPDLVLNLQHEGCREVSCF
jgi:hypothetical protein